MSETPNLGLIKQDLGVRPWKANEDTTKDRLEARLTTTFAGNPNTNVAGFWEGQKCYDTTNDVWYTCLVATGLAADSEWALDGTLLAASEAEVETGTLATKFVSPDTLRDADLTFNGLTSFGGVVHDKDWQTIASATTVDLAAATSNAIIISGTEIITGFGTVAAGRRFKWRASGSWTVTFSANVVGPQGATAGTYTMVSGVKGELISRGAGAWDFVIYEAAIAGTAAVKAASTNNFVITPGRAIHIPGVAKASFHFDGGETGEHAPTEGFGTAATGINRTGTGSYTVTWLATYAAAPTVHITLEDSADNFTGMIPIIRSRNTTTLVFQTYGNGVLRDYDFVHVTAFGVLA